MNVTKVHCVTFKNIILYLLQLCFKWYIIIGKSFIGGDKMPRPKVLDKKIKKNMRLRISLITKIKDEAKKHGIKEIEIIEQGIEMYIKYLNDKEV